MTSDPRALLIKTLAAALTSANPEACVRLNLPARPAGRVVVIACGKAESVGAKFRAWPSPQSVKRYPS